MPVWRIVTPYVFGSVEYKDIPPAVPELAVFVWTPADVESTLAVNVPLVVYTSLSLYVVALAACEVAPIKNNLLSLLVEPAVFLVSVLLSAAQVGTPLATFKT